MRARAERRMPLRPSSCWSPALRLPASGEGLLSRDSLRHAAARLHYHLNGVIDALARILDRRRQVFEREGVGVHFRRVETLLRHKGFGAMCRALALAADAVEINVVAHDVRDID